MISNRKVILILSLIVFIAGFLRFYGLGKNPPGLTGDEISFGYAAYSILETGRDESGHFLPLVIQSIGDYKNPLPAYLMLVSFKIFGVSDFAIRFQNMLFGTLAVLVFFFFLKYLLKNDLSALLGSFFLAISPWNIFYSRFAYEPLIASFFSFLGIWFFMKMIDKSSMFYAFVSAFFLILTMYTGFAQRLFIPVFLLFLFVFKSKKIFRTGKVFLVFFGTLLLTVLPLVYTSLFQGASTRFKMVFIANDINFVRYVIFGYPHNLIDFIYLFFFWVKRYLGYINPRFVFSDALQMVIPGNIGVGILYPFEGLFLILGIFEFIRKKFFHKDILIIWLFTGLFPDSITNNEQHAGRLLHIAFVVFIFIVLGALRFWRWLKVNLLPYRRYTIITVFFLFALLNILFSWLVFRIHFPYQKGESFDEGWREAIYAVIKYEKDYDKIIFDIRRGVDGLHIVSNPHMYLLFYSKYNPARYQALEKVYNLYGDNEPYFGFDKYSFGYINWYRDSNYKNALLVGSPWSFPKEEELGNHLLEKIYLSNGKVAFYIVSTK
ncbi:MAG: glycosyltransferase family 39 protein [Candidatus Omnitrophica bacterium]|nr:glycosyltransferase family 39 protein [Candidatus Omnitrophota bacterium]